MSYNFHKKDITFISTFLNNYCVEIADIYKLEGYIAGCLCCNDRLNSDDFLDYEADLTDIDSKTIEKFKDSYTLILETIDNNLLKGFDDKYNPLFIRNQTQATKFARGFLYSYFLGSLSDIKFAELNYKAILAVANHIDYELMHLDQNYSTFIAEVLKDKVDSLLISVNKLYSLISERVTKTPYISNNLNFNNFSETFH